MQGSVQIMRRDVGVLWRKEYSCFEVVIGLSYYVFYALGSVLLGSQWKRSQHCEGLKSGTEALVYVGLVSTFKAKVVVTFL